ANVLNGTDENCTNWIRTYKDYKPAEGGHAVAAPTAVNAPGEGSGNGGRRRGGREARMGRGEARNREPTCKPRWTDRLIDAVARVCFAVRRCPIWRRTTPFQPTIRICRSRRL